MKRVSKVTGFTLIELLIVVTVIGLLAGLLIPEVTNIIKNSKITRTKSDLETLKSSMLCYRRDVGQLPPRGPWSPCGNPTYNDINNLNRALLLNDGAGWNGPYLNNQILRDPWGHFYTGDKNETVPGSPASTIYSAGPDGEYDSGCTDGAAKLLQDEETDGYFLDDDIGIIVFNDGN